MIIPKKYQTKETEKTPDQPINITSFKLDLSTDVDQTVVCTIQGKTILTLGSLMVLTGKPKARKSTFLHTFLGTAIKKDSLWSIKMDLPENKNRVVLLDTEQSQYDLQSSIKRLYHNFNLDIKTDYGFDIYSVRVLDVKMIREIITTICELNKDLGVLAIDGLLDLVNDINSVEESKEAITFIKQICEKYQIAIIGILHQNKGTNFSLGHLGSFASRFAQSELQVVKNDNDTSSLLPVYLRSADGFNEITIAWDNINNRYDLESAIGQNLYDSRDLVIKCFNGAIGLSYAQLITNVMITLNINKYQAEKKIIPYWYDRNYLRKVDRLIQYV